MSGLFDPAAERRRYTAVIPYLRSSSDLSWCRDATLIHILRAAGSCWTVADVEEQKTPGFTYEERGF